MDAPEPLKPRPSHDVYVRSEFGRFFGEVYAARGRIFAFVVIVWLFFLTLQGCWTEKRSIENMYRLNQNDELWRELPRRLLP